MVRTYKQNPLFYLKILVVFIVAISLGMGAQVLFANNSSENNVPNIKKDNIEAIALRAEANCSNSDKNQCYPQFFYELTQKNNIKLSMPVLFQLQKIDPQNSRGCHFIAHRMSQAEVEKNPKDWEKVIKEVSPSLCTGGFLHGVLEVHAGNDKSFEINNQTVMNICQNMIGSKNKFGERSCFHSMGHLLLMQKEGKIDEAVNQCNTIEFMNAKYECLSGAFMETITQENLLAHGFVTKKDAWDRDKATETESLCRKYTDLPAKACWKEISFIYFAIHKSDPAGLYKECQAAPTKDMQDECFIYGAGNVVNTIRFEDRNLVNTCHQLPIDNPLFNRCMSQIIGAMLTTTTDNLDRVLGLCSDSNPGYRVSCYSTLIGILERNNESKTLIRNACRDIPSDVKLQSCA
jgi:hypothetical protein